MQHEHSLAQCRELVAQLNALIDGELADDLCAELREHLADCPECRVVFDTIGQTVQILHHLDDAPPPLPAELETRLLVRLKLGGG
ncbi:MAG: anti-sigma factor family protein [Oscillochloridaceae bacterium umkhey_bin13]